MVRSHLLPRRTPRHNAGKSKERGPAIGLLSRLRMLFKSKASAALDRAEDPRELVEYAYSQQQELLRKTKQGLIEVTTSKVRLEQQASKLRAQVPRVEQQAGRALQMGREDLARIALQRKQTVLAELDQLELQAAEIGEDERLLAHTEQELAVRVEQFRVRRDSISARYSAAQAQGPRWRGALRRLRRVR